MKIESITIENFKVFKKATVKNLPKMAVFLGANGSGKSTFFDIFSFLGDLTAVEKAYSRFKATKYLHKVKLRNVDRIVAPHKYLLEIIPEYSGRETLPKIETSSRIAPFMNVENNKSKSFNHTINAIKKLIEI